MLCNCKTIWTSQGLACLGSKKSEDALRSRYVGAMEVDMDSCEWRWCSSSGGNMQDGGGDDTNDSIASTVAGEETSFGACQKDGDAVLQKFHQLAMQWMECSILMPSSSCCSLRLPDGWLQLDDAAAAAGAAAASLTCPLAPTLHRMKLLDEAVSRTILPAAAKKASSFASRRQPLLPTSSDTQLWKRLLFESKGLQWLRSALGGDDAVQKMFANAYLNIQSISKPAEVAEAASKKGGSLCAPWALVQVAESDACACCLSLMRTPFEGFKRHSRNGVVFCFFGSRVFVSCMDDECRRVLRRQSKAYFCLAREAEEIHLVSSTCHPCPASKRTLTWSVQGRYDHLITLDRDEFLPSILAHSAFARSLVESSGRDLLEREARKRWNRVLMQGPQGHPHWMQQQAQRIRSGLTVTGCHEADQGSMTDLLFVRRMPSRCMCNSASEDRTWVELQEDVVKAYASWLSKRSSRDLPTPPPPAEQKERKKRTGGGAAASHAAAKQARTK